MLINFRHQFSDLYRSIDVNDDGDIILDEFVSYCKQVARRLGKTKERFFLKYLARVATVKSFGSNRQLKFTML